MERLKILRAAADLETFTVKTLAAYAGVNPATAQTVIGREQGVFVRQRVEATGRAGGQEVVYGIVADELRERIARESAAHPTGDIPLALSACYDTLLRRVPATDDPDARAELLANATLSFGVAQTEWPRHASAPRLDLHERCVNALLRLAKLESGDKVDIHTVHAWRALLKDVAKLARVVEDHGEPALAAALGVRMIDSRMQDRVCERACELSRPRLRTHSQPSIELSGALTHSSQLSPIEQDLWDGLKKAKG